MKQMNNKQVPAGIAGMEQRPLEKQTDAKSRKSSGIILNNQALLRSSATVIAVGIVGIAEASAHKAPLHYRCIQCTVNIFNENIPQRHSSLAASKSGMVKLDNSSKSVNF